MSRYNRILVPVDFSDASVEAIKAAIELALELNAELQVIHICQMHASDLLEGSMGDAITIESQSVSEAKKNLDEFIKNHVSNGISVSTSISTGDPHNEINQAAKELNADMIVMGTHGRTGLSHLVMGSVAENVLRHATVPVMSIRHA